MDEPTNDRREASRDNGAYNAIIDAEQEIWNRGASIRARCFVPRGGNCFTRWFWTWWYGGPDVGQLRLPPDRTYGDEWLGAYADIEECKGRDQRIISGRQRFKILTQPKTTACGIWCKAQRIQAQDYAATQNIRLSRWLMFVAIVQILVLVFQITRDRTSDLLQMVFLN